MIIDFKELASSEIYQTMIQTIIPRPIAWVLSLNANSTLNLAPFSYFNAIGSQPPLISMSVGKKKDGSLKDTRRNIAERDFFTVHIPSVDQAQQVTDSAKVLPAEESEVSLLGLETIRVGDFPVPRLRDCRAAFFCSKEEIIELGTVPQGLIIGRIHSLYLADECVNAGSGSVNVNIEALNPLARLGGNDYCALGRPFTITASE